LYLIKNIKIQIDKDSIDEILKIIKINKIEIDKFKVLKKSLDIRNKNNPYYIYNIAFSLKNTNKNNFEIYNEPIYNINIINKRKKLEHKPIIIGAGPAGLFSALILAEHGFEPIILEQGKDIDSRDKDINNLIKNRVFNKNSNLVFGEGGAGTYSDGKLTCRINDASRIKKILDTLIKFGAPDEISFLSKPHIGSDKLINIVKNFRKHLEDMGVKYLFDNKLEDIIFKNGKINKITSNNFKLPSSILILATGNSSREIYKLLYNKKIKLEFKPFSIGLRIEHLKEQINIAQYGNNYKKLKSADYFLVNHGKTGTLYSFCMCPGGYVVGSMSEEQSICTNGMSNYNRDGLNSNSALLVPVNSNNLKISNPLSGLEFQESLEKLAFINGQSNYNAPVQLLIDFYNNVKSTKIYSIKPSYLPGYSFCDFNKFLPKFITNSLKENIIKFSNKIKNFNDPNAILCGIETKSSSSIKILRNNNYESISLKGLFPCGEGSGYAGGIVSSAIDGIKVAEEIIKNYYYK